MGIPAHEIFDNFTTFIVGRNAHATKEKYMRVDKWLSAVNVVKRRTIATDMLKSGVVLVNGLKAKASKNVAIGDKVTIEYLKGAKSYEVLQIPTTKTIPKSQKEEYFKEL